MRRAASIHIAIAVVLAAAGCGSDDGPDAPAVAACTPARPAVATDQPLAFPHDGVERRYLLALPAGYDGSTAVPLVVNLHGHGGNMIQQEANTLLAEKGAARGFIVVTPEALGSPRRWNFDRAADQADDYGFIHALVADLSARLCVDEQQVAAAGHSNGSGFAGLLVCDAPYEFSAVALVSATTPSGCPQGVAPSVLAIHGTNDATVDYDGGAFGGAIAVIERYAGRYACARPPEALEIFPGVAQLRYRDCVAGGEVVLDSVIGGVHAWPGGPAAAARSDNSEAGKTFPASEEILDFFARQRRGERP